MGVVVIRLVAEDFIGIDIVFPAPQKNLSGRLGTLAGTNPVKGGIVDAYLFRQSSQWPVAGVAKTFEWVHGCISRLHIMQVIDCIFYLASFSILCILAKHPG